MENEVFISYSRKDYDKVKAVKDEIDRLVGIDCWMDLNGIESGEWFKKVIISAINRHDTLLFMLTPNSMNSTFAMKELSFAARKGKRIVLVDLENTQLNDDFIFDYSDKDNIDWNDSLQHDKFILNLQVWFPKKYDSVIGNTELNPEYSPEIYSVESDTGNSCRVNSIGDDTIIVRVGNIQFNMIRVEGGTLEIGATKEQLPDAEGNEYPPHRITLPTYYIGQFPVTQNLWEKVMGYNKSYFRDKKKSVAQIIQHVASDATTGGKGYVLSEMALNYVKKGLSETVFDAITSYSRGIFSSSDKGHYPAENLTYDEAQKFVRRLSEITNLKFDLPTEDEWEYAARGGQKTLNFKYAGSNNIDDVAWYKDNSGRSTHPVGEKQPNELGIFDMCGNVWEWTKTPAHSYGVDIKPEGNMFIRRGGSWWHSSKNCRVSHRYSSRISKKTSGLGLRVVIREGID